MAGFKKFKLYQKEILELMKGLNKCDDSKHIQKVVDEIKEKIEFIYKLNVDLMSTEEMEEVAGFVDYVNDSIKDFNVNKESDEPNI